VLLVLGRGGGEGIDPNFMTSTVESEVSIPLVLISPTHKGTEGRAPVWGSEFTIKVATLQGDINLFEPPRTLSNLVQRT
jgi:hypothetical protein